MINPGYKLVGEVLVTVTNADGTVESRRTFNTITNFTLSAFAKWLSGTSTATLPPPTQIGAGNGTTVTPAATDTALVSPIAGTQRACDSIQISQAYYAQFNLTYQTSDPAGLYSELGLFDASNNLWAHVAINTYKSSSQTLTAQWMIYLVADASNPNATVTNYMRSQFAGWMTGTSNQSSTTGALFNDSLTSAIAWSGSTSSYSFGSNGATGTTSGQPIIMGNNSWKPISGSGGQNLALTAQATFTTPPPGSSNSGTDTQYNSSTHNYIQISLPYTATNITVTQGSHTLTYDASQGTDHYVIDGVTKYFANEGGYVNNTGFKFWINGWTTGSSLNWSSSVTSTPPNFRIVLYQDANNMYYATWQSDNNFVIYKIASGTQTTLTSTGTGVITQSTNTPYTLSLSLDKNNVLTATLSGGVSKTINVTDATPLNGGFKIGVGGDTGVIISNASVNGPILVIPTQIALGTGSGTPQTTDTALWTPAAGTTKNCDLLNVLNSYSVQFAVTYTTSDPTGNFTEAAWIDTSGNVWLHAVVSGNKTGSLLLSLYGTVGIVGN